MCKYGTYNLGQTYGTDRQRRSFTVELEKHLASLPDDKEIVAYCRGPYCLMSVQAAEILASKGIHASRLEEGVYEWN
ncbi:rhodanese-like domain-containing protein [Paenibacillus albiflavus]|uniref:Rhodanese-like domain-containing protein n=1 Tax=Paenibacillus albiflavus TaxID=2545760 RepID=A0A4R4EIX9_9BACL|nr:rhodanese-like domain-containing protein [Paenibacillus albiflavus]TCZ78188.1 rhodanese-like domain-containing protein [Paenibacillus albiflavus]